MKINGSDQATKLIPDINDKSSETRKALNRKPISASCEETVTQNPDKCDQIGENRKQKLETRFQRSDNKSLELN